MPITREGPGTALVVGAPTPGKVRIGAIAGDVPSELPRVLSLLLPLSLVLLVIQRYELEGPVFRQVVLLAVGGFAVHAVLPLRYRLRFFVLLSLTGIVTVFGLFSGAWLIAAGLVLIGICHLPLGFGARIGLLLSVGAALAFARGGVLPAPWSGAVWPILGSMFMFRLALYLHALRHERARPSVSQSLAYFFMLPNVPFPLFPIVDYSTFTRTYFDRDPFGIYHTGLVWIVRGLLHLVLYRFVYLYVVNDPADILNLGDVLQFLLGTFLLYLRVSGQFHLIVGILHLFGFRLPETHHLYFLASSFTDFWRRINIYWKDFMMKLVYYPSFFRLRRRWGNERALVAGTIAVFLTTWLLHSYQWFWLRGDFPLTAPDGLFWGLLGALVVVNVLWEVRRGSGQRPRQQGWSLSLGIRTVATFTAICVLWSLWSAESVTEWLWMWAAAGNAQPVHLVVLGSLVAGGVLIGGRNWDAGGLQREAPRGWTARSALEVGVPLVALLLLSLPAVRSTLPQEAGEVLASLERPMLNARESTLQHKGYYEKLDLRNQLGTQLWDVVGSRPAEWTDLAGVGMLRPREDFLGRDLYPSRQVVWNGQVMTTNSWGMRDQEYALAKPEGTLRIALLGPSHAMGNNVSDGETFEALLEERLNQMAAAGQNPAVEILNFAVDGHVLPQQLALLEERVLAFQPDIVIVCDNDRARYTTESFLLSVVTGGASVPYPEVQALLEQAGLVSSGATGLPVPFESLRRVAGRLGWETRMPWSESVARMRGLGDPVVAWSLHRIAEAAREAGAVPVMVAMNTVVDPPRKAPALLGAASSAGFLVLNLFDVFEGHDHAALQVAPWDTHPNASGHRLIADRLFDKLQLHRVELGLTPAAPGPGPQPPTTR
jgi:D-alanyl-lipoteichoic acid acyltransferase DltB (MBOAT superfamily)